MSQNLQNRTGLMVAVLVIVGLTLGAALGLLIGWVIAPVRYVDTTISDLSLANKEEYTMLVALAYSRDGDLEKAQSRLEKLEVPNLTLWMEPLVERYIDEGGDETDIRALVALADALGVNNPKMVAYLATATPLPTATPEPTDTPLPPTDTPLPTDTTVPPTDTATPLPQPTETSAPTETPLPPTDTPQPEPTNTPKPKPPTKTPAPPTKTPKPVAKWTWNARLLGPADQGSQQCHEGAQYIRVTVVDANNSQIGGVWIHDLYTNQYQVTGHKADDQYWGVGEAEIPCAGGEGGAALCIAQGQGGPCETAYTRGMSCYKIPSVEDLHAAGYCDCCEVGASVERCQQLINDGRCMGNGHYSWHVVFRRSR